MPHKKAEADARRLYQLGFTARDCSITLRIQYQKIRALYLMFKEQEIPVVPPGQRGDLFLNNINSKDIEETINAI